MREKTYKVTLTTLSNLHIGSGDTYQSFDYYIEDQQFCFIDQDELVNHLVKTNQEDTFIQRILNISRNEERDIHKILSGLGIQNLKPLTKYCLKGLPEYKNKRPQLTQIERFNRNGEGNLVVPGSSIKGFISNCLSIDITDKYDKEKGALFSISDSFPLANESVWVSRVGYYNHVQHDVEDGIYSIGQNPNKPAKQRIKINTGQSNYVEFIKPNTQIEFILKIKENPHFNMEMIQKQIQKLNNQYRVLYQIAFYQTEPKDQIAYDPLYNNEAYMKDNIFRLGKYTNLLLKTNHLKDVETDEELYQKLNKVTLYRDKKLLDFPMLKPKAKEMLLDHSRYHRLFPTALKLSKCPDQVYRENGICVYRMKEITHEVETT